MPGNTAITWDFDEEYVLIDLSGRTPGPEDDEGEGAEDGGDVGSEILQLFNDAGSSSAISMFAVIDSGWDDVIKGDGLTAHLAVYASGGNDTFLGGSGNDFFRFDASELTFRDTVAGNGGFDTLALSSGGLVSASALAHVTGIDALLLSGLGNEINLTNALVAGSTLGVFTVVDGGGNDIVDASAVTNGMAISFSSSTGNDTFLGGSGNDYFLFSASGLSSLDTVVGGTGFDYLVFSTAGIVAPGAFTNVSGIDAVRLNDGGNQITVPSSLSTSSDAGMLAIFDGTGNDIVDGASSTAAMAIYSSGGTDAFFGGAGNDFFSFAASQITSVDTVDGGLGFDALHINAAGALAASAFAGVTEIDALVLADAAIQIELGNSLVGGSEYSAFAVVDGLGDQVVDAGGVSNGIMIAFYSKGGDDTFIGGNGNDFFAFGASLTAADTADGGDGFDAIYVANAGTLAASAFDGVSNIEALVIGGGDNTISLPASLISSSDLGQFAIVDGIGDNGVDASAADASKTLAFYGAGGADTFMAGAGDDYFIMPDTNFALLDGGAGLDRILLTSNFAGKPFDLSAQASKIDDVEIISLSNSSAVSLSLTAADILEVNATGEFLYVTGGSDDELLFDASGWHVVSTSHVNAAVDPGATFIHLEDIVTGADLYLSDQIALLI